MIQTSNLSFAYANTTEKALQDVSLEIKQGECVLLCGGSGCGKTTLTRLFNGLIPNFFYGALQGECKIDRLSNTSKIEEFVPLVGSVFQNPKTQYFNSNTTDELAFSSENMGMNSKEIQQRIRDVSKQLHIEQYLDKNLFYLSGGEKQKIAFAAAWMLKPKILVLDEPTSNLDDCAIQELREMIEIIKQQGVTIVIAEHRIAWIMDLVDHFYLFSKGRLNQIYTKEEFQKLSDIKIDELGLRTRNLQKYEKMLKEKNHQKEVENPCIELKDLEIGYSAKQVVRKLPNIQLARGEIVGLMGHNGVGKSTLAKTLSGLMKQIHGNILMDGKELSPKERIANTFLVMQDVNYQLFSDSVKEEIQLGATSLEDYEEIVDILGLKELQDRHPMSLSGGQKQRVVVAAAMLSKKPLVILDEPTSGLDQKNMNHVGELLTKLKEQNKTVMVITHDIELASLWCDRIINLEE